MDTSPRKSKSQKRKIDKNKILGEGSGSKRHKKSKEIASAREIDSNNNAQKCKAGLSAVQQGHETEDLRKVEMRGEKTKTNVVKETNPFEMEEMDNEDGVSLNVSTSEYENSDEEGDVSDDESDCEVGNVAETSFNDEVSEVTFNHKGPVSNDSDQVFNMVEKLVESKMKTERMSLQSEYKKIQQLKDKYEDLEKQLRNSKDGEGNILTPKNGNKNSHSGETIIKERYDKPVNGKVPMVNPMELLKSPSDTTIYAPGLMKSPIGVSEKEIAMNKIANFVEEMRITHERTTNETAASTVTSPKQRRESVPIPEAEPSTSDGRGRDQRNFEMSDMSKEEAKELAKQIVVEAEQFKASIEKPQGKQDMFEQPSLTDDNFFHLICHVDSGLRSKIVKGEYIDLEKLLPQDKMKRQPENATRLGWWQKGNDTFLAPVDKDRKINNVRKWDQAFRIYSTIYCRANPERTGEIWQYIDIIHTAAGAFVWDNVANYDYIFRQLMEFNPKRSWGLTYNQMWNLSMVEPLSRFNNKSIGGSNPGRDRDASNNQSGNKRNFETGARPDYDHCWAFQRGNCRFGANCRYDNRCSYCDSTRHGRNKCPKLEFKSSATKSSGSGNKHAHSTSKPKKSDKSD